jgi:hypothetical protein
MPDIVDFIVIGAMKSGTNWLYRVLQLHPEVNPCRIKEPNFFLETGVLGGTWGQGPVWYNELFERQSGLRGEASTGYTKYPTGRGVPARIKSVASNAKFIYLVREPVDRAISHYIHNVLREREQRSIEDALLRAKKSGYIEVGLYYTQLEQYLEHFPAERFCVITSEALWKSNRPLASIADFLGIGRSSMEMQRLQPTNTTAAQLARFMQARPDAKNDAQKLLAEAIQTPSLSQKITAREIGALLGLGPEQRALLRGHFLADTQRLENFIGRTLDEWKPSI